MTSTAILPGARRTRGGVTFVRVVRSEWIKLRSLRSTLLTLLASAGLLVGLGALYCAATANRWPSLDAAQKATFDPAWTSLNGIYLAQLAIGVLGVLTISGEYATGMIRATLSAVPRRLPVLWAKAVAFAAVAWATMTAAALAAFFVGQAVLSSQHVPSTSLGDPSVLRAVLGTGVYLTIVGLLSVGLGTLIRSTAGGIATVTGLMFVVPVLTQMLPQSWQNVFNQYLPTEAGMALLRVVRPPHTLAPWTGLGLFTFYAAIALAGGAMALKLRDA